MSTKYNQDLAEQTLETIEGSTLATRRRWRFRGRLVLTAALVSTLTTTGVGVVWKIAADPGEDLADGASSPAAAQRTAQGELHPSGRAAAPETARRAPRPSSGEASPAVSTPVSRAAIADRRSASGTRAAAPAAEPERSVAQRLAAWITSEPRPQQRPVDLLAGDDGLDPLPPARPSGARPDDPALALLEELDRPRAPGATAPGGLAGNDAGAPTAHEPTIAESLASWLVGSPGTAVDPGADAQPGAPAGTVGDPRAVALGGDPSLPGGDPSLPRADPSLPGGDPSLPRAGAAPAAEPTWLDTVADWITASPPSAPGRPTTDLLAADDGLEPLAQPRPDGARPDDPALALVEEPDRAIARSPTGSSHDGQPGVDPLAGPEATLGAPGALDVPGVPGAAQIAREPGASDQPGVSGQPNVSGQPDVSGQPGTLGQPGAPAEASEDPRTIALGEDSPLPGAPRPLPAAAPPPAEPTWLDTVTNWLTASPPSPSEGEPGVDLLAGDGLDPLPPPVDDGPRSDDPALAMLAELERPTARPPTGSSDGRPGTTPQPGVSGQPGTVAGAPPVGVTRDPRAAVLGDDPQPPGVAAPPAEPTWRDTVAAVASWLTGTPPSSGGQPGTDLDPSERPAAAPDLLAGDDGLGTLPPPRVDGPRPGDPALAMLAELDRPVPQVPPASSEGRSGVDLLAGDDGLGTLGARPAAAPIEDPLAEFDLDGPTGGVGGVPGATRSAAGSPAIGGAGSTDGVALVDDPTLHASDGVAAPEPTWLDTVTSWLTATPPAAPTPPNPPADPALVARAVPERPVPDMPMAPSEGRPSVDLLAGDDGLGTLGARPAAAPIEDPLAEFDLDGPTGGVPGATRSATGSPTVDGVDGVALVDDPTLHASDGVAAPEPTWLDTVASWLTATPPAAPTPPNPPADPALVARAAPERPVPDMPMAPSEGRPGVDLLAGDDGLGTLGARPAAAPIEDPLAEFDLDGPTGGVGGVPGATRSAAGSPTVDGVDGVALVDDPALHASDGLSASEPTWRDTVAAVASWLTGTPPSSEGQPGTAPDPSGRPAAAPDLLAGDDGLGTLPPQRVEGPRPGDPALAMLAELDRPVPQVPPAPSEGRPGVDLLAGDDGLGTLGARPAAAPIEDPLAEFDLDGPSGGVPGATRSAAASPAIGGAGSTDGVALVDDPTLHASDGVAAPEPTWLDTVASWLTATPPAAPTPPNPPADPALVARADLERPVPDMPMASSEGRPGVDLLAGDDGLGTLGARPAAAPIEDPLAEFDLDGPTGGVGGVPGVTRSAAGSPTVDGVDGVALVDDPALHASDGLSASEPTWRDTVAAVASWLTGTPPSSEGQPGTAPDPSGRPAATPDLLAGDDGLGTLPPPRVDGPRPGDPALAMLAELDRPVPQMPPASSEGRPGVDLLAGDDGLGTLGARPAAAPIEDPLAEFDLDGPSGGVPGATRSAAGAPAIGGAGSIDGVALVDDPTLHASDGVAAPEPTWLDTVASWLTATPPAAPTPPIAPADPALVARAAPERPVPDMPMASSEGRPGVDLLAGDDGLGTLGARPAAAPIEDPLAEFDLDGPSGGVPSATRSSAGSPTVDGVDGADGVALVDEPALHAGDLRSAPQPPPQPETSWVDRVASWIAAAPPAPPMSSEGEPGVDLLAGEDGLPEIGAPAPGPVPLSPDDPAMQLLASLDEPSPPPAPPAPRKPDSWMDSLVSWAIGEPPAPPPPAARPSIAPGTPGPPAAQQATLAPAPAPARRPTPRPAPSGPKIVADYGEWALPPSATDGSWLASIAALAASMVGSSPPPAPEPPADPLEGYQDAGFRDWSQPLPARPNAPIQPAPPPCLDVEHCDPALLGWRDGMYVGEMTPYGEEEFVRFPTHDQYWIDDLFYRPGEESSVPQSDLRLNTLVVRVRVDVLGVPIDIDGARAGYAPTIVEVAPGRHTLTLYGGEEQFSVFEVLADSDPDQWCFVAHGRQFRRTWCD